MNQTPEEYAAIVLRLKPYIAAIEERARTLDFGTIEASITVRAGEVEKMEFVERKTWLRPKA